MKKRYIFAIGVVCLMLLVIGFLFGYNFISKLPEGENIGQSGGELQGSLEGSSEDLSDGLTSLTMQENYISPNTTIDYTIYYLECGHKARKSGKATSDLVNMSEEKFKSIIKKTQPNWRVVDFSPKKIVVEIDKEQLCPEHYIIGVKDGNIAVFKVGEDGEKQLKKVLDSPISMLRPIDQEKLLKGILVHDEEEISDILENFIS